MNLKNVTDDDTLLIDGVLYDVTDVSIEDIGITEVIVIAAVVDGQKRLIETTTANSSVKIVDTENETYWTGEKDDIEYQ